MEEYLDENIVDGLQFLNEKFANKLELYIKLFIILYADDTVFFAESATELQKKTNKKTLSVFEKYCIDWKLSIKKKGGNFFKKEIYKKYLF